MVEMSLLVVVASAVAFAAGGVASGAVGMGAGLIAAPLLSFVDPHLVPYTFPIAFTWASLAGWYSERDHTQWRRVGWWTAGSVPGWVAGAALIVTLDQRHVVVAIALFGLGAAALISARVLVPARWRWWLGVGWPAGWVRQQRA